MGGSPAAGDFHVELGLVDAPHHLPKVVEEVLLWALNSQKAWQLLELAELRRPLGCLRQVDVGAKLDGGILVLEEEVAEM